MESFAGEMHGFQVSEGLTQIDFVFNRILTCLSQYESMPSPAINGLSHLLSQLIANSTVIPVVSHYLEDTGVSFEEIPNKSVARLLISPYFIDFLANHPIARLDEIVYASSFANDFARGINVNGEDSFEVAHAYVGELYKAVEERYGKKILEKNQTAQDYRSQYPLGIETMIKNGVSMERYVIAQIGGDKKNV